MDAGPMGDGDEGMVLCEQTSLQVDQALKAAALEAVYYCWVNQASEKPHSRASCTAGPVRLLARSSM